MATAKNKRRRDPSSEQLPKSEDWIFRIKVISSATDLHNDLFRDAVRGLVRICFPDGILDQLGQHVVEEHMLEEHASTANIQRMSEIFKYEVIHRLVGMFGNYFDTPQQVVAAVQTALGAQDHSSDDTRRNLNEAATEESSPRKKRRRNKSLECGKTAPVQSKDTQREDALVEMDAPVTQDVASTPDTAQHRRKDRKISSTWAWDVDSADCPDEVSTAFPRTADLFAYHALPIIKKKLGPKASRKELRLYMQSMLDGLPQDEIAHWIPSLELLHSGDRTMLVRSTPSRTIDDLPRMTPAPGKSRARADVDSSEKPIVKQEAIDGNVLTKVDESPLPIFSTTAAIREPDSGTQRSESVSGNYGIPVLRLLLGIDILTPDLFLNNPEKTAATIIGRLEGRMPDERISTTTIGGQSRVVTKIELHASILSAFSHYRKYLRFDKSTHTIGAALLHWVVANPKAFPELKAMPFVFAHALPHIAPVINLLFGSWPAVSGLSRLEIWEGIRVAQQRRRIPEESFNAVNPYYAEIAMFWNDPKIRKTTRRAYLERVLRCLAFAHRDKFPELKGTSVVKNWEERTSLVW